MLFIDIYDKLNSLINRSTLVTTAVLGGTAYYYQEDIKKKWDGVLKSIENIKEFAGISDLQLLTKLINRENTRLFDKQKNINEIIEYLKNILTKYEYVNDDDLVDFFNLIEIINNGKINIIHYEIINDKSDIYNLIKEKIQNIKTEHKKDDDDYVDNILNRVITKMCKNSYIIDLIFMSINNLESIENELHKNTIKYMDLLVRSNAFNTIISSKNKTLLEYIFKNNKSIQNKVHLIFDTRMNNLLLLALKHKKRSITLPIFESKSGRIKLNPNNDIDVEINDIIKLILTNLNKYQKVGNDEDIIFEEYLILINCYGENVYHILEKLNNNDNKKKKKNIDKRELLNSFVIEKHINKKPTYIFNTKNLFKSERKIDSTVFMDRFCPNDMMKDKNKKKIKEYKKYKENNKSNDYRNTLREEYLKKFSNYNKQYINEMNNILKEENQQKKINIENLSIKELEKTFNTQISMFNKLKKNIMKRFSLTKTKLKYCYQFNKLRELEVRNNNLREFKEQIKKIKEKLIEKLGPTSGKINNIIKTHKDFLKNYDECNKICNKMFSSVNNTDGRKRYIEHKKKYPFLRQYQYITDFNKNNSIKISNISNNSLKDLGYGRFKTNYGQFINEKYLPKNSILKYIKNNESFKLINNVKPTRIRVTKGRNNEELQKIANKEKKKHIKSFKIKNKKFNLNEFKSKINKKDTEINMKDVRNRQRLVLPDNQSAFMTSIVQRNNIKGPPKRVDNTRVGLSLLSTTNDEEFLLATKRRHNLIKEKAAQNIQKYYREYKGRK